MAGETEGRVIEIPEAGPENPFKELEPIKDAPMSAATVIGSVALNMALRYHDINTIQDGALYQQYKLEGRNIRNLHLDDVFHTAIQIEKHLLKTNERIAEVVFDAIENIEADEAAKAEDQTPTASEAQ